MNAESLPTRELAPALLRSPHVVHPVHAALRLLVEDWHWLKDPEFLRAVVISVTGGVVYADVDWQVAATVPDTSTEPPARTALLRLACSLAGRIPAVETGDQLQHPWSVRAMLEPLDQAGTTLAITAVAAAATGGRL